MSNDFRALSLTVGVLVTYGIIYSAVTSCGAPLPLDAVPEDVVIPVEVVIDAMADAGLVTVISKLHDSGVEDSGLTSDRDSGYACDVIELSDGGCLCPLFSTWGDIGLHPVECPN